MYKRKNDEVGFSWGRLGSIGLGMGLITLFVLSASAVLWWLSRSAFDNYTFLPYATALPYKPTTYASVPTIVPAPVVATMRLRDARFVFSTTDGLIMTNADGAGVRSTALRGSDVTVAPDGQTLAYLRDNRLYVYHDGKEQMVKVYGNVAMPAWSADGNNLAFVVREASADVITLLNLDSMQATRLMSVAEIAAPPLSNPATGRLLIVEKLAAQKVAFYTIDPNCATQSACLQSRKDIATVWHTVSWASYHPSATSIVFSDRDDGELYSLATATGKVSPLPAIRGYKRRPAFSKDGTWLAYLNDGNQLYALRLDDNTTQIVSFANVASVDWTR